MIKFFDENKVFISEEKFEQSDLTPFKLIQFTNRENFPNKLPYFSPKFRNSPIYAIYTPQNALDDCQICLGTVPLLQLYCGHTICVNCSELVSSCPMCKKSLLINSYDEIQKEQARLIKYGKSDHFQLKQEEFPLTQLLNHFKMNEIEFFSKLNLINNEFEGDRRPLDLIHFRQGEMNDFQKLKESVIDCKIEMIGI